MKQFQYFIGNSNCLDVAPQFIHSRALGDCQWSHQRSICAACRDNVAYSEFYQSWQVEIFALDLIHFSNFEHLNFYWSSFHPLSQITNLLISGIFNIGNRSLWTRRNGSVHWFVMSHNRPAFGLMNLAAKALWQSASWRCSWTTSGAAPNCLSGMVGNWTPLAICMHLGSLLLGTSWLNRLRRFGPFGIHCACRRSRSWSWSCWSELSSSGLYGWNCCRDDHLMSIRRNWCALAIHFCHEFPPLISIWYNYLKESNSSSYAPSCRCRCSSSVWGSARCRCFDARGLCPVSRQTKHRNWNWILIWAMRDFMDFALPN